MNRQKVREAVQSSWTCEVGKAEADLGFHATISLEAGLSMTWAWYREQGWLT
jgi:nucleoside-diphosphate-sugar epimerase